MEKTVRTQMEYWKEVKDPVLNPDKFSELQGEMWDKMDQELINYLISLLY